MLNAGMSMFASANCLKDCASLYDELCLLFRLLISALISSGLCSWVVFQVVLMFVASSSSAEGRGRDTWLQPILLNSVSQLCCSAC